MPVDLMEEPPSPTPEDGGLEEILKPPALRARLGDFEAVPGMEPAIGRNEAWLMAEASIESLSVEPEALPEIGLEEIE